MSTPERTVVLMVGATGMLLPAVRHLASLGKQVLVVARRPAPAVGVPGVTGVSAHWERPAELADAVAAALRSKNLPAPNEAILWVHSPYRAQVGQELARVLAPGAVVVELFSASGRPSSEHPPPHFAQPLRYRAVVLGHANGTLSGRRWLTSAEISDAAIQALSDPAIVQVAGQLDG